MTRIGKVLKALIAGGVLAIAIAAPTYTWAASRAEAIRECSIRAGKYIEHTRGDVEIYQYRACMAG